MAYIGGYELVEQLPHADPMVKAFDRTSGRYVALKEQPGLDQTKLQFDAMILGMLDHPNIARIFSTTAEDGLWYLVQEWVDGADLGAIRDQAGRLTVPQAVTAVRGALRGLAFAHNRQIVHGDVSLRHILVSTNGESKLIDFGVAVPDQPSHRYRSPEVLAGAPATKRSDVFSTAAVLADLLGVRPGRGHFDLSGIDRSIAGVMASALSENPEVRQAAGAQLLEDLEGAADRSLGSDWPADAALSQLACSVIAERTAPTEPPSAAAEIGNRPSGPRHGLKNSSPRGRRRWWRRGY
ncbi:serine/threonine-protein kinase [Nakamurella sp. PAMC28650]|uniref:serine/threonine-protein kinase n=1 Tax=Nakamurella sp. PAMC28650 TaxID=2762325 RepID=UPI00164DB810|nr:serine/threonine-protein kinase [Nakamurella sp. PAMC28650]QNK79686.1 serine/threonine protein kinase [Nakamurella sp. PAMC28650]